jgi:hypothetical protein
MDVPQKLLAIDDFRSKTEELQDVELGTAEGFTLSMVRVWVRALTSKKGSSPIHEALNAWNHGFCQIGNITASKTLDQFMSLLARKSQQKLVIGCPDCQGPNQDERKILGCMYAYQSGDAVEGRRILLRWLNADDVCSAEHQIILFVATLSERGYVFGNTPRQPASYSNIQNESQYTRALKLAGKCFASNTVH